MIYLYTDSERVYKWKRSPWYCCDRKAPAASVQSFTLWQQATIEIMHRDHSIIACSCHIYMGVVRHAHSVRSKPHIQHNASGEVATTCPPFYNEPHQSHVLCVKVAPGTTFTFWSQHHFVAIEKPEQQVRKASHWQQATEIMRRDHSIIACSCHIYMGVVLHAHSVRGEPHIQHNASIEVAIVFVIPREFSITVVLKPFL